MTKKKRFTERHFRGLSTIEDVRERCYIDVLTECWHWRGSMKVDPKGRRVPCMWVFDTARDKFRTMSGPMAVLELTGRRTPEMDRGWRTCLCDDCVNPAHIAGGTIDDWGAWIRANGVWKNSPARVVAGRKAARARSTLTIEQVQKVRAAESTVEGARILGITESHASKIRLGKVWADGIAPGCSVFSLGRA